jgi:MarR family 2-MHQ and catechol resistance regulon transcriptional repressor
MPTHYQGSAEDKLALDAFIKVTRAHNHLMSSLAQVHAKHGLTPPQFGILETLWHLGPLNQQELCRKLLTSKPNVSAILNNLEKNGLVRRVPDARDGRAVQVQLSAKGRQLIEEAFPVFLQALKQRFSCLSAEEMATLASISKRWGLAMEAQGGG